METNFWNRACTYVKKHAWGFSACCLAVILIASITWLFVYGFYKQAITPDLGVENIWISLWGTRAALACLFVACIFFIYVLYFFDYNYVVKGWIALLIFWLGASTLLLWGCFFGIPFVIPIAIASVAYLIYSYKNHESKRCFIWHMVIFLVAIMAVCIISYHHSQSKIDEFHQEIAIIKMTVKEPVIEVVDAKSDCILTKEHGLERVINDERPQKGDKIHRLSVGEGEVYIVICKRK